MKTRNILRSAFLVLSVVAVLSISISSSALEEENEQELVVVEDAGKYGCYEYDISTPGVITETYIPAESTEDIQGELIIPASDNLLEEEPEPYAIIGNDDRKVVTEVKDRFASTCLIGARFFDGPEGVTKGTGFLINRGHLMTAAHCLCNDNKDMAKHVAVYVGASGGNRRAYRVGRVYRIGEKYKDTMNSAMAPERACDDWGLLRFDSPLSDGNKEYPGHLGIYCVNSSSDMQNRTYQTQGYPADKNSRIEKWDNWEMYTCSGTIYSNYSRTQPVVTTSLDFTKGQSGSAVYSYRTSKGYCAEAIISSSSTFPGEEINYLVLINDSLLKKIHAFCD